MSPTLVLAEEVVPVLDQLIAVLDNKAASLQGVALANMMAVFALNCAQNGEDPFSVEKNLHTMAQRFITENLAEMGVSTTAPKGARPFGTLDG